MMKMIHRFFSGYYNILLILLTALFIFRPHGQNIIHLAVWQLLLSGTFLTAIFNAHHSHKPKIIVSTLAVPTVILCWANLFHPVGLIFIGNIVFIVIFMTICTCSVIYDVVIRARVSLETLRGVVCAYFMVAILFGYIFYLLEFIFPNSFHLLSNREQTFFYAEFLSEFLYYSYSTLLTMPIGDILPIGLAAQTFFVIEGIIGQFYIAILVARIVAVYAFVSDKKTMASLEKGSGVKKSKK